MGEDVFEIECPCCGARVEVDAETQTILSHTPPQRSSGPEDLSEAVRKLKSQEASREERFRKHVKAERQHEKALRKRFDGLLKKARSEGTPSRILRDIDLD